MFRVVHFIKVLILLASINPVYGYFQKADQLYNAQKILNQAISDVASIGLNCADPTSLQKNYEEFLNYTLSLFKGISEFSVKAAYLTMANGMYPNFCHVYNSGHVSSYNEGVVEKATSSLGSPATLSFPQPEYYWPKYLIEVTESGLEHHRSFIFKNPLWVAQSKVTDTILRKKSFNALDGLMLAMVGNDSDSSELNSPILSSLRNQRITGAEDKDWQSFEVSVWPVALSNQIASRFSVCGEERKKYGLNPGGVEWKVPMVPMTCSLATTRQVGFLWDMGLMDIINPASVKKIAIATNPASCSLDYVAKMAAKLTMSEARTITQVAEAGLEKLKAPFNLRKSLLGCGFPPLGDSESLLNSIKDHINKDKIFELSCSPWGSIFPRSSREYSSSEFKFINSAIKFKSLANEILGVDRGDLEKWTMVYPRNIRSSNIYHTGDPRMIDNPIDPLAPSVDAKDISLSMTKAGVLQGMSPEVAAAYSIKKSQLIKNGAYGNSVSKRRIYLISEKIKCVFPSSKLKVSLPGGGSVEKYESCSSAIKLKVHKYFQLTALRKICDVAGMFEGLPWML